MYSVRSTHNDSIDERRGGERGAFFLYVPNILLLPMHGRNSLRFALLRAG